ncbi:MAG TPA: hypothetical protein VEV84_01835 [Pyrinomonadaceae bacterium]|jgi:hypothetical protein|nr:hypothetical protein [Pyrinomonadaceae bacterium]
MFAKIYWYACLAIGAIVGLLYITGSMTTSSVIIFGFVSFGMTFMGMMNVLPWVITHAAPGPFPEKKEEIGALAAISVPHGAHPSRI